MEDDLFDNFLFGLDDEAEDEKESVLEKFTEDITQNCIKDGGMKVVGRDKEIARLIEVLSRKTKNNPVLVGDPGVGKTSIVLGLAQAIVNQNVNLSLLTKRILSLNVSSLVSGTIYRGQFEERVEQLLKELKKSRDVILFIDELHTVIGAGNMEGQLDVASILKAPLSSGEIQVIGATTVKEYTQYIEKNAALARRFQKIDVAEPNDEEAIMILKGIKRQYETFHGVKYDDDVMGSIVKLSRRYMTEQYLPDKAIDLMDEAGARVRLGANDAWAGIEKLNIQLGLLEKEKAECVSRQDFEKAVVLRDRITKIKEKVKALNIKTDGSVKVAYRVTKNDVAMVVSSITGIPLESLDVSEEDRLLNMESEIHKSLVGQEEAVNAVCNAVRRSKVGISNTKRPLASFLFLGPTGVGKTQLVKVLAKFIFGTEDSLMRIDMSDYSEENSVSRLVGTAPGYVGHEEGGILTNYVRRRPYSIVLLDEIEKANPKIFNLLLQMLEEGQLSDKLGHIVNFRNTIIVMTSNAGSRKITQEGTVGFGVDSTVMMSKADIKANATNELKKLMNPEIINRIDEVIVFEPLNKVQVAEVLKMQLDELKGVLKEKGYSLTVKKVAMEYLQEKGFDPTMGARPMRRLIQKEVESPLSLLMLDRNNEDCNVVAVGVKDGALDIKLTKRVKKSLTKQVNCPTM